MTYADAGRRALVHRINAHRAALQHAKAVPRKGRRTLRPLINATRAALAEAEACLAAYDAAADGDDAEQRAALAEEAFWLGLTEPPD